MSTILRITRSDEYVHIRMLSPTTRTGLTLTPKDLVRTEEGFKPAPQATNEEILTALFASTPSLVHTRHRRAQHPIYRVVRHSAEVTVQRYLDGRWQDMATLRAGDWLWPDEDEEKPTPVKEASDAAVLAAVLFRPSSKAQKMASSLVAISTPTLLSVLIVALISSIGPEPSDHLDLLSLVIGIQLMLVGAWLWMIKDKIKTALRRIDGVKTADRRRIDGV